MVKLAGGFSLVSMHVDGIGNDAILILQYLLPGFLAAWIFYGLTPYELPSQFERVVHALILTLIIQTAIFAVDWIRDPDAGASMLDLADGHSHLVASTFAAVVIGLSFSYCANHDTLHRLARKLDITQETSYPSEWFGAFRSNVTYVVLQLVDERRLYGWPREWPSDSKEGHFLLEQPSWLMPDGSEEPVNGVSCMLVSADDVKWVEFMQRLRVENVAKEDS